MRELAKKRLQGNFQQSAKYLALVFNDFFVLALIFIFGAVMFWYAQVMKVLPVKAWYYPLVLSALLWLAYLPGKLVTLLQTADRQFLLATDDRLDDYLAPMRRYSLVLPALLLALAGGIMYPFASLKMGLSNLNYFSLVLALFFAKVFEQRAVSRSLTFDHRVKQVTWLIRLVLLALLLVSLYFLSNALYLLLALAVIAVLALRAWKIPPLTGSTPLTMKQGGKRRFTPALPCLLTSRKDRSISSGGSTWTFYCRLLARKVQTASCTGGLFCGTRNT